MGFPLVGDFGKDVEAGANVFASLGVVGGKSAEGVGPMLLPVGQISMQLRWLEAEARGIAADFVEGYQAVIEIKRGVLDAFGHRRGGQLLEFRGEGWALEDYVANEVEQIGGHRGIALDGAGRGKVYVF